MSPQMSARIFNLISIIFLLLSVVVLVWGVLRFVQTPPPAPEAILVPTPLSLPTITPSFTPRPTLPPTFTPTNTDTPTPTQTDTPAPTLPPTATITSTPAPTSTPGPTNTPLPTETPVGPATNTPSPFPFSLRDNQVTFTTNFANTAGCDWQGIAGQVFDLNGQPFSNLQVHVFGGENTDLYTISGSNTLYGQGSGWEIPVGSVINNLTYFVELRSPEGTPISPTVQITFPGSCQGNLAIVNFVQTRPF
jgi:hypothetical protein